MLAEDMSSFRVLVADDNQSIHLDFDKVFTSVAEASELDSLSNALFGESDASEACRSAAFELEHVFQGAEAVEAVRSSLADGRPFDMAFLDVRMPPGIDGVEAAQRLWELDEDLQVVLCTAYSDYGWDELRNTLGVTDRLLLLKKPFDKIEALLMAQSLSAKRRWIASAKSHMAELEQRVLERTSELRQLAETDRLTGLANREAFLKTVQEAIDRHAARPTDRRDAIIFLDLDHFKIVNDTLGHRFGDELLRDVAQRLLARTRHDQRVARNACARLGGDEFAVLIEDAPGETELSSIADRLTRAISQPFQLEGREIRVSASVGIALVDGECRQAEQLLARADMAMYDAKRSGRARMALFDQRMWDSLTERMQLEQELRSALANREFYLVYQPVMDLRTGRPTHFEALLRWSRQNGEIVLPAHFLPLAEQCGLLPEIGGWVLDQSCEMLAKLRAKYSPGCHPRISVNVAGAQLLDESFSERLCESLRRHSVPATDLILEVTEAGVAVNQPQLEDSLEFCAEFGLELHMDDFGTGMSSLQQLRRFPYAALKVDSACLAHCSGLGDYSLLKGIRELAGALGIEVIAEGIESADHVERLTRLGYRLGQGYHLARPSREFTFDPAGDQPQPIHRPT